MKSTSLFDIIEPIMVGPSSSHTAGAVRLGLLARNIYNLKPKKVTFKLYNSYAQTGLGHGTDKGLLAGVLGFGVDDKRIKNIFDTDIDIEYTFEFLEDFNRHPNAVDFIFEGEINLQISGDSVGAGNIQIRNINEFNVKLSGEYNTLILVYKDKPGMISTVSKFIQDEKINIASLHCDRSAKGEDASMCICLDSEIDEAIVEKLSKLDDIYLVRNVRRLK